MKVLKANLELPKRGLVVIKPSGTEYDDMTAKDMVVVQTEDFNPNAQRMQQVLLDKHYLSKHGKNAYYGNK